MRRVFMFKRKKAAKEFAENRNLNEKENIDQLLQDVVDYFTSVEKKLLPQMQQGIITKEAFLEHVDDYLSKRNLDPELAKETKTAFEKYIWGYHVLDDLIEDESISDIKVMNENNIRVKRLGRREGTNVKFRSKDDYKSFVNYVAVKNKVNISDLNAIQTFTDRESNDKFILRFSIITQFITSTGTPYIHIRKIPKKKLKMDKLQELAMFDEKTKKYLIEKAKSEGGILFTGKGASGKTTLMNALLEEIPHNKSGLVIQENEELFADEHPEMMFEHIVVNRGESKIKYDLRDLAQMGLLTDLDYFIIGEIKGAEALYLLNASYTGHICWASVHGNSAEEAMNKLADYVKYEGDYTKEDILKMLASISTVIFLKDFKVEGIAEIKGWDEETQDLKYEVIL